MMKHPDNEVIPGANPMIWMAALTTSPVVLLAPATLRTEVKGVGDNLLSLLFTDAFSLAQLKIFLSIIPEFGGALWFQDVHMLQADVQGHRQLLDLGLRAQQGGSGNPHLSHLRGGLNGPLLDSFGKNHRSVQFFGPLPRSLQKSHRFIPL
jgi:hypothetical protein